MGPGLVALSFVLAALVACEAAEPEAAIAPPPAPAPLADGTLRVSLLGSGATDSGLTHETTFVNGVGYTGFSDNDIRGFLDGRFQYGWNQPLQAHVRVGRRHSSPRSGEPELFRVLPRWADLRLPADVSDSSAR